MEIVLWLEKFNQNLSQWAVFRGFKMILAFYLVIMVLAIILFLLRLREGGYFNQIIFGEEIKPVKGRFRKDWEKKVSSKLNTNHPDFWKASVLEAATLLTEALRSLGYRGETLKEQLAGLNTNHLANLASLKKANAIKNKIIIEQDFKLSQAEAKQVVEVFGEALRSMEAID